MKKITSYDELKKAIGTKGLSDLENIFSDIKADRREETISSILSDEFYISSDITLRNTNGRKMVWIISPNKNYCVIEVK